MCSVPTADQLTRQGTHGLVGVDHDPLDATLMWLPGLNSRTCRVQQTTLSRPIANQLARDLLAAPTPSPGNTVCPGDDGSAVTAYFRFAHRTDTEVVYFGLLGCRFIGAPDRLSRTLTHDVAHDLGRVAPPEWREFFTTG